MNASGYTYKQLSTGEWQVGYYHVIGYWVPYDSKTYPLPEQAAAIEFWLNGGYF